MEIRVSIKFSLIHEVLIIMLHILNKNLNAFKSGSFCFGLLYLSLNLFDQSFMGIEILNSL